MIEIDIQNIDGCEKVVLNGIGDSVMCYHGDIITIKVGTQYLRFISGDYSPITIIEQPEVSKK